jgi:glucose/mannose-6-phosphate isomerase
MLDDLKLIHERDAQDALGIAEKQWQQLAHEFTLHDLNFNAQNVVFSGMGGSALAALMQTTWPNVAVPFTISRNYDIPPFVNNQTLFIASSYSGNTEETLEALTKAEQAGAHVVIIAAGGTLLEKAKENNYPYIELPQVSQPRYAALYSYKALITILAATGLVSKESMSEIDLAVEHLRSATSQWRPDVATAHNYAKQLALDLIGSSAVIYAGPLLFSAAYKWKISINENAKNVAWCNQYPEFNHNEFLGWTSHPLDKPYKVVDLRSSLEHQRTQKRFELSAKLLSGRRPAPIVVKAEGDTLLKQLVWTIALGDFVSLYMAILNGLNPTPVDLIERFKKELN